MPYAFADTIEAKSWLRLYAVRHDLSWHELMQMMDEAICYNPASGKYVPFASKLYWAEKAAGVHRQIITQKTLKPKIGPIVAHLNSLRTDDELADFLATLLFDHMVAIASEVKQKRSSRAKGIRKKAEAIQEREPAGEN